MRIPLALLLAALVVAPAGAQNAVPDTAWADLFLADVEAAAETIARNHPGPVDDQNPAFRDALERARADAQARAPSVEGFTSYRVGLARFAATFEDVHLSIHTRGRPFDDLRSAGLYPVLRDGQLVVADAPGHGALVGATLLDCDGRRATDLLDEVVQDWGGNPSLEADRTRHAPFLLVHLAGEAPSRCRVEASGEVFGVALDWGPVEEADVGVIWRHLVGATAAEWRVETFDDGLAWVRLPSFATRSDDQAQALRWMIERLAATDGWRTLAFDVRGNGGGSSAWADEVAAAVFGEEWVRAARAWLSDGVWTEWRVSEDNVSAARRNATSAARDLGPTHPVAGRLGVIADSLAAALARGDATWGVPDAGAGVSLPDPPIVPGRIVLVTDGACASACLGFVDLVTLHPATVHVGRPTSADSQYMEAWGTPLPSGLAWLGYPMKVYRGRKRAAGDAVEPDVRYRGPIGHTLHLRQWVRSLNPD